MAQSGSTRAEGSASLRAPHPSSTGDAERVEARALPAREFPFSRRIREDDSRAAHSGKAADADQIQHDESTQLLGTTVQTCPRFGDVDARSHEGRTGVKEAAVRGD